MGRVIAWRIEIMKVAVDELALAEYVAVVEPARE